MFIHKPLWLRIRSGVRREYFLNIYIYVVIWFSRIHFGRYSDFELEISRDRSANIAKHINVELFSDRNSVYMRLFAPFFGLYSWMLGPKSAQRE